MLIVPDINELGDKRLNGAENVAKQRELALKQASANRIEGQDELEKQERSAGPRLHFSEIIKRIRECNPHIQAIDGSPGNVALYIPKKSDDMDYGEPDPKGEFFTDHKYAGGMPKDWLPEFSHVVLDTSLLPVREIRGWRSVLITLIRAGAISYRQAVNQFGEARGQWSGRWHEQLARFK